MNSDRPGPWSPEWWNGGQARTCGETPSTTWPRGSTFGPQIGTLLWPRSPHPGRATGQAGSEGAFHASFRSRSSAHSRWWWWEAALPEWRWQRRLRPNSPRRRWARGLAFGLSEPGVSVQGARGIGLGPGRRRSTIAERDRVLPGPPLSAVGSPLMSRRAGAGPHSGRGPALRSNQGQ